MPRVKEFKTVRKWIIKDALFWRKNIRTHKAKITPDMDIVDRRINAISVAYAKGRKHGALEALKTIIESE